MEKKLSSSSGAAKRRKLKETKASLAKLPKLIDFLKPIEKKTQGHGSRDYEAATVENDHTNDNNVNVTAEAHIENLNESTSCDRNQEDISNADSDTHDENEHNVFPESCLSFSSDMANFEGKILSNETKKMIILTESCRPKGPFIRDLLQNFRSFSTSFYKTSTKFGIIERKWLCYSPKLDAVYCEPCWLFAENRLDNWRQHGIRDWRGLSKKIKTHENSQSHITACCIYEKWRNNETIDKDVEQQIRYESNFWVQVLERLVNITLSLSKNSLSFRGHRETLQDEYSGNFLMQVQLLSKYDTVMKQLLTMPHGSIKYLSPQIQNEIIHCLATRSRTTLVSDINSSPFYTIIMDTTQDITKKDQLSQIFRYAKIIKNEKDEPVSIEIREVFLGFTEIHNHSAAGLYAETLKLLSKNCIQLSKCRGQGYDGAKVMSGTYRGVQALLKQDQPNAAYIHCVVHNLNLVVNDAVKCCTEVSSFFTILEDIYSFFGNSVNRWDLLSKFSGESQLTLKRLNPTRWAGRYTSLLSIKIRFVDIMKALSEINLTSSKRDERDEALRIQKNMSSFEFVFMCVFLSKILSVINVPSKILQTKNLDLMTASVSLENAFKQLKQYRNMFDSAKNEAIEIAKKWGITATFAQKRRTIVKRHFDELARDHRFNSSEEIFRINVFLKVVDVVVNQLNDRFKAMEEITKLFSCIQPNKFVEMNDDDLMKSAGAIQEKYKDDLSEEFPLQMVMVKSMLKEEISGISSIRELAEVLIIKYPTIASSVSQVITCLLLFLTLPVTVATAERSFSKLKIIKNYLRNSIGTDRLSDLSILSIEAKAAADMETKTLIRDFANMKSRAKTF